MTSFTLHKTASRQVTAQSTKSNGSHSSSPYAASSFPDPAGTHFDMIGYVSRLLLAFPFVVLVVYFGFL